MKTYPSLYAALEPNGQGRTTVRCTATRRALGDVWWEAVGGTTVVWHWRTVAGDNFGERTTERNCVQALRDIANLGLTREFRDEVPPTTEVTPRRVAAPMPKPAPAPTPTPAPVRQIVWGTDTDISDLHSKIADAFARHK